ncbi:hypothetical protein OG698_43990 [Streptomyces sp. NBC_01003]|uniref:hypothetical protein n=1 Tax=Streptomyces sp. NBC_01003 TaxID=2903714 RepID=UPI00386E3D6C|nr:hypothetical protein OG698_43990 [Streptomyces sp. NBC_01003]
MATLTVSGSLTARMVLMAASFTSAIVVTSPSVLYDAAPAYVAVRAKRRRTAQPRPGPTAATEAW